jgi:hypothetical protein
LRSVKAAIGVAVLDPQALRRQQRLTLVGLDPSLQRLVGCIQLIRHVGFRLYALDDSECEGFFTARLESRPKHLGSSRGRRHQGQSRDNTYPNHKHGPRSRLYPACVGFFEWRGHVRGNRRPFKASCGEPHRHVASARHSGPDRPHPQFQLSASRTSGPRRRSRAPPTDTALGDINNRNQIVGIYGSQETSFLDDRGAFSIIAAPFPGTDQTIVSKINNEGQIVGGYHNNTGFHGFIDDRGTFSPIDVPFSGAADTIAGGINERGQIVGQYDDTTGVHGFLDDRGRFSPIVIPLSGVSDTFPRGINNRAQIVGFYNDTTGSHGFLIDRGRFTAINVPFSGAHDSAAFTINNRGQIVGAYSDSNGMIRGFLGHSITHRLVLASEGRLARPEGTALSQALPALRHAEKPGQLREGPESALTRRYSGGRRTRKIAPKRSCGGSLTR